MSKWLNQIVRVCDVFSLRWDHSSVCPIPGGVLNMDVNFLFMYGLGQKYYAPQVQPDRGSNS